MWISVSLTPTSVAPLAVPVPHGEASEPKPAAAAAVVVVPDDADGALELEHALATSRHAVSASMKRRIGSPWFDVWRWGSVLA